MSSPNLRQLVERATSEYLRTEDWEYILEVCDAVNANRNGPTEVARLIVERLQNEGEKVQLLSLTLLEALVKNCGPRFHAVVCRYDFLNELIKLVSKKYTLYTTEPVRRRILGLIQQWRVEINHPKIQRAYESLLERGHHFPLDVYDSVAVLQDKTFLRPEEKRRSSFDEAEQNRMLSELLKSKDPKDLSAANALIKEMVHADDLGDETDEKIRQDLDIAANNIELFHELLDHWTPSDGPLTANELLQELLEALRKMKPRLGRLAVDLEDEDDLNGVLPVYRNLRAALRKYANVDANSQEQNQETADQHVDQSADDVLLLDLDNFDATTKAVQPTNGETASSSILDEELLTLDLGPTTAPSMPLPMNAFNSPLLSNPALGTQAGGSMLFRDMAVVEQPISPQTISYQPMAELGLLGASTSSASPRQCQEQLITTNVPDLASVTVKAEDFQPSSQEPIVALDRDGVRVLLMMAAHTPHPALAVVSVSVLNHSAQALSQIDFEVAVPKSMQVKLQPPTATSLNAFSIMTGPAMATQILIISNPNKEAIRLRFKLSYTVRGAVVTHTGDVRSLTAD